MHEERKPFLWWLKTIWENRKRKKSCFPFQYCQNESDQKHSKQKTYTDYYRYMYRHGGLKRSLERVKNVHTYFLSREFLCDLDVLNLIEITYCQPFALKAAL